jgi:hypothetical protein
MNVKGAAPTSMQGTQPSIAITAMAGHVGAAGAAATSAGAGQRAAGAAGVNGATSTIAGAGASAALGGRGGLAGVVVPQAGTFAVSGGAALPQAGTFAVSGSGGALPLAGVPAVGTSGGAAGSRPAAGGAAPAAACDRTCLLNVLQQYLDALVAHDPSKLAIAPSLKMTDNGVSAKPGDGLWKTATMLVSGERLDFADPVTHNVATQCVINEGSTPVMYEVRLKVDAGEITEIESITVRQADAANGFFDPSNVKPQPVFAQVPDPATRMSRDALAALQDMYLDYLEGKKDGSQVPFDQNCSRYENGVATASGLSSFQLQSWSFQVTRRVLIIDEEAGITYGMFPFMQSDTALVVGEAFKMLNGKIMMIQAIMAYMPSQAWN